MSKEKLIVVPGLGDQDKFSNWLASHLEVDHEIHLMPWKGEEHSFVSKLQRLLDKIDDLTERGYVVSLLGISAGGSAVLNSFCQRQEKIVKVVNVCGRLRKGYKVFPTLEQASRNSPAFRESVGLFDANESKLSAHSRKKVLTIRPVWDEVVPVKTVALEGAENIQVISVEHMLSIVLAMTVHNDHIKSFLHK